MEVSKAHQTSTVMDVGKALGNASKGRLKYDTKSMKDFIDSLSKFSSGVPLNISPKIVSEVIRSCNEEEIKKETNEKVPPTKPSTNKLRDKSKDSDTIFYQIQTETELPILEYEEERMKYIHEVFKVKKDSFENHSKNLEQQTEQQYNLLKRNIELDGKRRAVDLKRIEEAVIEEAKEKELLLKQHQHIQAKRLSAIVLEAEMKQKKAEEEMKRREQEQKELAVQFNNCKIEAENCVFKAQEKLKACEHPSFLKVSVSDRMNQIKKFLDDINAIVERVQSCPLTIEDVFSTNDIVKKTYEILQDVTNDIEHAKVKALQDHERTMLESTVIPKENDKLSIDKSATVSVSETPGVKDDDPKQISDKTNENEKSKLRKEAKEIISAFMAPDVVEEYHKIMENLKSIQNSIQPFIDEPRNKKYRFELQKSINVPINAISSVSGAHVRDKISRLLTILGAKAPSKEITNESVVYNFCANLIARKFVEQGDKQISAQHSTAFPFALAVVGIWIKKPDVGSLILGHFYSNCPYLVPYYPPRKENQSDKEYFESLGYYFDNEGNMEAKYKFLSRMSGFMRLYAAIILSPVPPGSTKYPHPHGIALGWRWLSSILNMDPRPDITATLLFDFLEVTGHALQKTYGKQFRKLLHIICKDFFQKIKRVTPSGSGGPVERLETFLQQTIKKGYIPRPEGILDAGFWNR